MASNQMVEIRTFIRKFFNIIYRKNPVVHKEQLEWVIKMSDSELRDKIENGIFELIIKPYSEPSMIDIKDAAKFLDIELDEYLILPSLNNIVTENKVPVGYVPIKFLEQITIKKITQSHKISEVNPVTGGLTQTAKTRSFTAPESINLFSYGVEKEMLNEFFRARSDDKDASADMHTQISENGVYYQKHMSTAGIGQSAKTLNYYLIGAGIESDIIPDIEVKIDGKKQDIRRG
jgi:hypothetical protein